MSEIIIEEIVDPEIKKQKPPETVSKEEFFKEAIKNTEKDPEVRNDKMDKK